MGSEGSGSPGTRLKSVRQLCWASGLGVRSEAPLELAPLSTRCPGTGTAWRWLPAAGRWAGMCAGTCIAMLIAALVFYTLSSRRSNYCSIPQIRKPRFRKVKLHAPSVTYSVWNRTSLAFI